MGYGGTIEEQKEKQRYAEKKYYIKNKEKIISRSKEWKKNNPDKVRTNSHKWYKANSKRATRNSGKCRLVKNYNITIQDYENMYYEQLRICPICEQNKKSRFGKDSTNSNTLVIDHCHKSGKIRSLLCHSCNLLLGHAKDNISILQKAINYINYHSQIQ